MFFVVLYKWRLTTCLWVSRLILAKPITLADDLFISSKYSLKLPPGAYCDAFHVAEELLEDIVWFFQGERGANVVVFEKVVG